MTDSAPILRVRNLTKAYYGIVAVDDVSFDLEAGSITSMIGPNGSGKSTTIDCITGFQRVNAGRWFLEDRELTAKLPHVHALAGMARTFQTVRAYDELPLVDNLRVARQEHDAIGWWDALRRSRRTEKAEALSTDRALELLEIVNLSRYANAPAEILSYGQRKLLAIACVMMTKPKVVILDEPVAGVNPTMIRGIEDIVRKINAEGVTVLFVEHNVEFVMNLSHRVVVLDGGKILAEGPPELIHRDQRVLDAYLGAQADLEDDLRRDPRPSSNSGAVTGRIDD
jgi:branched-chain amino acid transport system ATP-binding protein